MCHQETEAEHQGRNEKSVAVNGTTTGRPQGLSLNTKSRLAVLSVRCTGPAGSSG